MLKQLYALLSKYRRDVLLTPSLIFGEVLMELFIPYVMADLVDQGVLGGGGISYTVKMDGLMILMAPAALIFGALARRLASRACTRLAADLHAALFGGVMDFSFSNVGHFSSASLITRLTSDVTNVQNAFLMILRMDLRAPILLTEATSMTVPISHRLPLILLAALPILAVAIIYIMKNGYPCFQRMLCYVDDMNAPVQENLTGIRVVKAYVREEHGTEKFTEGAEALWKAQFFAERLILLTLPILQLIISGCIVVVVWFDGNLVIVGGLELEQLSALLSYVSQILISLMFLSMIFLLYMLSRASVARIQEMLARTPSIQDILGPPSELADGSTEFIDASFSYDELGDSLTLECISLSIHSGEMIGIIGGAGSARSTLVQLTPRLHDLSDSQLLVGGRPVQEYSLNALCKGISMVLQRNTFFSGTIRENLLQGGPNTTQQELENAYRAAQTEEFIDALPDDLETHVERGGANSSGGQKQRLCITRALPSRPEIMVLGDSTSTVGTATDTWIREDLRRGPRGATVLLITQRIGPLHGMDHIIVIENGMISGVDAHKELFTSNPIYREIAESQEKRGMAT